MSRRFVTLDVFTTRRGAGNPLAVVLDAEGLDDAAMQAIAREFNLSETVFVGPPADPKHRAALRIFTPARELPFAGHPTVGTAVLLGLIDAAAGAASDVIVLEEKVGLVPCAVAADSAEAGRATFTLPRLGERVADAAPDADLAAALGLSAEQIGFDAHRPAVYSGGVGFTLVPVRDLAALAGIKLDLARMDTTMRPKDHPNAFVYTRGEAGSGHDFRARMFAPSMGMMEDPATGSAVAAFTGAVMAHERPADGEHTLLVGQGYEMGRASDITLELSVAGGALVSARVGGSAVMVSEGRLL